METTPADAEWVPKPYGEGWSGIALLSPSGRSDQVRWLEDWEWRKPAMETPAFGEWRVCHRYLDKIAAKYGRVRWARVLQLDPGGVIDWHTDALPSGVTRAHVSLHGEAVFEFRDRTVAMPTGQIVVIDPKVEHRVTNPGSDPRINLVVDVG